MNAVTHLEKVIVGEVSAVTHLEKVIAGETSAVTYTEKVITGEATPITHLEKVIAGEASPVTHLEYVWAGGSPTPTEHEYTGAVPYTFTADGSPLISWRISGNTVQNGTPTPDNPIMPQGTGERTGNLFDKDNLPTIYNNKTLDDNGNEVSTGGFAYTAPFIDVTAGEYITIAGALSKAGTSGYRVYFYNGSTFLSRSSSINPANPKTFQIPNNCNKIALQIYTLQNYPQWDTVMINNGETALPYEPYGYKIPISSASTTTPVYLGEVETTRKIKKLVLDGTENWGYSSSGNNARVYLAVDSMAESPSISTHYQFGAIRTYPNLNEYCINNASALVIGVNVNSITSAADFKSYLAAQYAAGTPVTVWYVLANEETAVVNEPLMKIDNYADEVSNVATIPTNNGSTTIDVETAVKPSEIYIKYKGV